MVMAEGYQKIFQMVKTKFWNALKEAIDLNYGYFIDFQRETWGKKA